jgi:DNA-binding transcriptional regulator YdaS (Cro superfamily)
MRTTLDIDDDVFLAAKELAAIRKTTAGQVISELARQGIDWLSAGGKAGIPQRLSIAPKDWNRHYSGNGRELARG